ncbi:MAG: hypothetical protein WBD22_09380 [Pyrinomonadaceae bacterium]
MITEKEIRDVISQYETHGWKLRRLLVTGESRTDLDANFAERAETIVPSEIDAAWFSRSNLSGGETWELRHLGGSPFALLEVLDDGIGPDERERSLHETEIKMMSSSRCKT